MPYFVICTQKYPGNFFCVTEKLRKSKQIFCQPGSVSKQASQISEKDVKN